MSIPNVQQPVRPKPQPVIQRPLQLVEEAFHLVRRAPRTLLATYCIGTIPFVLGLLYFVQDMSLNTYAHRRLAMGSVLLAALFAWMKVWQARFAAGLAAFQAGSEPPRLPWQVLVRQGAHQIIVQSGAAILLLLAVVLVSALAPAGRNSGAMNVIIALLAITLLAECFAMVSGWRSFLPITGTMSFFQNFSILGDGQRPLVEAVAESARLSRRAGRGTSVSLLLLLLLGWLLMVNLMIVLLLVPQLLESVLGIDTLFSRGGQAAENSTLKGIAIAMTFLAIDPLNRALHVLLCFYGLSERTGQDLRGRFLREKAAAAIAALVVAFLLAWPAAAQEAPPGNELAGQLNEQIDQVIIEEQYSWRPEADPNQDRGAAESVAQAMDGWWSSVRQWFRDQERASRRGSSGGSGSSGGGGSGGGSGGTGGGWGLPAGDAIGGGIKLILFLLLGAAVIVLIGVIIKAIQGRSKEDDDDLEQASDGAMQARPDLTQEDTTADQLPEEGWLGMAAELLAKHEYRLALRAMYLACLAGLAQRELVRITRAKSNREYVLELRRRAHAAPGLLQPFEDNVVAFENAWYGMHDVSEDTLQQFRMNQQAMYRMAVGGRS